MRSAGFDSLLMALGSLLLLLPGVARGENELQESFSDVEVRVIRQKAFQKSKRFELNASLSGVMNTAFLYNVQGSGALGFHWNEELGVFAEAGVGQPFNDRDCNALGTDYRIEPEVDVLQRWYGGGVVLTPGYGKYQLPDGAVQYVDWFASLGGGMAHSVLRQQGFCVSSLPEEKQERDSFQISASAGQRFFLGTDAAFLWSLRWMQVSGEEGIFKGTSHVFATLGMSYFL